MLFPNLRDIAIITVKDIYYRFIIHDISKSEVIHLLKNSVLDVRGYMFSEISIKDRVYNYYFYN